MTQKAFWFQSSKRKGKVIHFRRYTLSCFGHSSLDFSVVVDKSLIPISDPPDSSSIVLWRTPGIIITRDSSIWFYFYVCKVEKQEVLIFILPLKFVHIVAFSKDDIK